MNIDLHTHTTASDGSMTPAELVKYAKSKGLKAIAITDHDTVAGLAEAIKMGEKLGLEVIPGIEIGVDYISEMHILGYFISGDYSRITGILDELKERRKERNVRIVQRLNEIGLHISMEELVAEAAGAITGRPHIAKILMQKGYVNSIEEAFQKYLASGRPAYFKKDKMTPGQGIGCIKDAGGLAVLAHPIYLGKSTMEMDSLLDALVKAGLSGIEVYYPANTGEQTIELLQLAEKHGLLVTGGSDFHGSIKPDIDIGSGKGSLNIPYEILVKLKGK